MIRASCHNCNLVVHYHHPSITLEQVMKCPPFHNFPREPGECNHHWLVKEIKIGR